MPTIDNGPMPTDWKVYVGDANEVLFEFSLNGDPWDLTTAEILAEARKTASDPEIVAAATVTAVDLMLGRVLISWDGEALRAALGTAESWTGVFDLQIHPSGELPRTVLRGAFVITMDVSRGGVPG